MPRRSGLKFTAPPPCTGVVPAPTVAGGPDLAAPAFGEAGSITLDGSRSGCYFKPCQFKFVVNCTGKPGVVKQGASTAKITISFIDGNDIVMRDTPSGVNCTYAMTVTDNYTHTTTYTGTLWVSMSLVWGAEKACGGKWSECMHIFFVWAREHNPLLAQRRPQVPPLYLYPELDISPSTTLAGGDNVTLDASRSVCTNGGCTYQFRTLGCGPGLLLPANDGQLTRSTVTLTSGYGPGYDIDMSYSPNGMYPCIVGVGLYDAVAGKFSSAIGKELNVSG